MDTGNKFDRIIRDLKLGDYQLARHAKQRIEERQITPSDIQRCAETTTEIKEQADGKVKVSGKDLCGEALHIIAA
jgi:hypothetical protein